MENKEVYKTKIENQLAKWKSTIEGLKIKIEQAEVNARAKLHERLDGLHDKRARAEKLLEELSATSQEAWKEIRAGVEQGWRDISRTAKTTMAKVRQSLEARDRDEEIRQIAFYLWLDEGCPQGRHHEHWLKAESIWRERRAADSPDTPRPVRRRKTVAPPRAKKPAGKARPRRPSQPDPGGLEKP